jgi:hypothetical protein
MTALELKEKQEEERIQELMTILRNRLEQAIKETNNDTPRELDQYISDIRQHCGL